MKKWNQQKKRKKEIAVVRGLCIFPIIHFHWQRDPKKNDFFIFDIKATTFINTLFAYTTCHVYYVISICVDVLLT